MPTTSSKSNRVGRLAGDDDTALDDAAEEARIHDLAKAVVRALTPGNGRKSPCEEDELRERLEQDGAVYNSSDLPTALSVLETMTARSRARRTFFGPEMPGRRPARTEMERLLCAEGKLREVLLALFGKRPPIMAKRVDAARHHRHGDVEGLNQA